MHHCLSQVQKSMVDFIHIRTPADGTTIPIPPGGSLTVTGIIRLPSSNYTIDDMYILFNDRIAEGVVKKGLSWSYTGNIPRIIGDLKIEARASITDYTRAEPPTLEDRDFITVKVEDKIGPVISITIPDLKNGGIDLPEEQDGLLTVNTSIKDDYFIKEAYIDWTHAGTKTELKINENENM